MVVQTGKKEGGFLGYELSAGGAKELWKVTLKEAYASPILCGGYAYNTGGGHAVCVEMKTGEVKWKVKIGAGQCSSPLIADGKLITLGKRGVVMAKVSPEGCKVAGSMKCGTMTYGSPACAGGKLYLRMNKGVACYAIGQDGAQTGAE
jgi:outer membrane protein assembly factor BamB